MRKKISILTISLILIAGFAFAATTIRDLPTYLKGIIIGEDQTIQFEGATSDAYETTLTVADPTADNTITFPDSSGTVALSAVAGSWTFEGDTADDYETVLQVTDPTKDVFYELSIPTDTACAATGTACAIVTSSLALNGQGAANSVNMASNAIVFEGATANTSEAKITSADVTADVIYTLPDAAAATYGLVTSTLAANGVDIVNAVWGGTNQLIMEGATANTFEAIITPTDPTADRTFTLPDASGTVALTTGTGSVKSFSIETDNVTMTSADCGKVYGMGTAAKVFNLPATVAGCTVTFINTGEPTNNIVTVNPDDADQIFGLTRADNGDKTTIHGDVGETINNTAATSDRGDFVSLVGDGADGWYIVAIAGIWAEGTP